MFGEMKKKVLVAHSVYGIEGNEDRDGKKEKRH